MRGRLQRLLRFPNGQWGKMRRLAIWGSLAGILFIGGCGVSRQEVAARLGEQYVGQNVDALVVRLGPPSNSFRLTSGGMSYEWQLAAKTDSSYSVGNGYASGTSRTKFCKVRVTTAPNGIVGTLDTEDTVGSGGLVGALTGVNVAGRSLCADYLGMRKET
jgi:hypothetical protein